MTQDIAVGVGTILIWKSQVLLGLRTSGHWCLPGGRLEFGETPQECAIRETKEETGLIITEVKRGPWLNDCFFDGNRQFVTLFVVGRYAGGVPETKEKEKFVVWQWFPCDMLPSPLFSPIKAFIDHGHRFTDYYSFFS